MALDFMKIQFIENILCVCVCVGGGGGGMMHACSLSWSMLYIVDILA